MTDIEARHIEEIVIWIASAGKRVIGLTSPEGDGLVDSIAWSTAEFLARSGRSVLFIDLQQPLRESQGYAWAVSDLLSGRNIISKEQCLDVITITPNRESRYAFADTGQLRTVLESLLDVYQFIILELGPVLTFSPVKLNPLPAGAACDYLLLTCPRGSTNRAKLENVVGKLRAARCILAGIILNEAGYVSVGAEIAPITYWLFWPMPRLRRRVQRWVINSDLLN